MTEALDTYPTTNGLLKSWRMCSKCLREKRLFGAIRVMNERAPKSAEPGPGSDLTDH